MTVIFEKYLWLLRRLTLAGSRGMTLVEIQKEWEGRFGSPYTRRTFAYHRDDIRDIFGVDIRCNLSNYHYYIDESSLHHGKGGLLEYAVQAYTVADMLSYGKEMQDRIDLEDTPSGQLWMSPIMEAMHASQVVQIRYGKYGTDQTETLDVHPYGVKESSRRWYLVGWCEQRGALRVYGLDRIRSIQTIGRTFEYPDDFDMGVAFANSYGVYLPDPGSRVEHVLLRATPRESSYLRDLPLHSSQKEVRENVFSLDVIPNDDLVMEICSRGHRLEVLEPLSLREKVREEFLLSTRLYEDGTTSNI